MYGHKQSGSRQLNRHWQSGGARTYQATGCHVVNQSVFGTKLYASSGFPPLFDKDKVAYINHKAPVSIPMKGQKLAVKTIHNSSLIDMYVGAPPRTTSLHGTAVPLRIGFKNMIPILENNKILGSDISLGVRGYSIGGVNMYYTPSNYDNDKIGFGYSGQLNFPHDMTIYNPSNTTNTVHLKCTFRRSEVNTYGDEVDALDFDLTVTCTNYEIMITQSNIVVHNTEVNLKGTGVDSSKTYHLALADPTGQAYICYKDSYYWPLYAEHFADGCWYRYLTDYMTNDELANITTDTILPAIGLIDGKAVFK